MRNAVRVVQHPDAFLEDVPPAAELQQLLARYRAQVASGRGSSSGAAGSGTKGKGKKVKKPKEHVAAVGLAADAAGEVKPKKKKKKSKRKTDKQQQPPVYLSQMDHLLHTVSDAGVQCELREAEAHEMRQAAARKHWAAVPSSSSSSSSSSSNYQIKPEHQRHRPRDWAVVPVGPAAASSGADVAGGDGSSSRGRGIAGGCSRIERLLSSLSGKQAGENAVVGKAVAPAGTAADSTRER
jgi:hypothetical protein